MSGGFDLIILGAGGTGGDVADWLLAAPDDRFGTRIGFLDDDPAKHGTTVAGLPVFGALSEAVRWPNARFVNALGSPSSFRRRGARLAQLGIRAEQLASVVHPTAVVSRRTTLGPGAVVYPGAVVCGGAVLEEQVILLAHAVVNHDARVGARSILATAAAVSGGAVIGQDCYLGAGAQVLQGIQVGHGSLVGMGAVVLREVGPNSVVAGNPARLLRTFADGE